MVSRILISIALLFSSVAFSQEESALKFNQVLLVELTEEGIVVPEGKVWKVVSQQSSLHYFYGNYPTHYFYMNSMRVDIVGTGNIDQGFSQNQYVFPIWAPANTLFQLGELIHTLSIIEFNTD